MGEKTTRFMASAVTLAAVGAPGRWASASPTPSQEAGRVEGDQLCEASPVLQAIMGGSHHHPGVQGGAGLTGRCQAVL